MDENKKRALAAALGQIEKQFGKGSIMRLGNKEAILPVSVISTASAISAGMPSGYTASICPLSAQKYARRPSATLDKRDT